MNSRVTLVLALAAGWPVSASAQERVLVHTTWNEVVAGSNTPASGPLAGNSVVDPGEGARIRIGVTALINGTNAVGQTTSYTFPPPPGFGTVRGLGSVVYDLYGNGGAATAQGVWGPRESAGQPFNIAFNTGTVQSGGSILLGIGAAQFITPGNSVNAANNNQQLFRGVWTPAAYAVRNVHFLARPSEQVPNGQHNAILVAYGLGTSFDPKTGDPFNYDLLIGKYLGTDFGAGVTIPVIPVPSTLALLGLAGVLSGIRRRG